MSKEEESSTMQAHMARRQNEFNVVKARIDTTELLERIEYYLRGSYLERMQTEDGQIISRIIKHGIPKANPLGVQSIMSWTAMTLNAQVVQGNFTSDKTGYSQMYEDYCYWFQCDLGDYLMTNLDNFGIELREFQGIIDGTMNIVRPYMTRLIDNKERESYAETTKSTETNVLSKKGGFFAQA